MMGLLDPPDRAMGAPSFRWDDGGVVMEQTGGCLCGAVRYRVTGAPQSTSLCHCFSCRRSTGGPSLAWAIFDEDKVEIVSGTPAVFESSPGVERGFCAQCGSTLTCANVRLPTEKHYYVGAFERAAELKPTGEFFPGERLPWLHL